MATKNKSPVKHRKSFPEDGKYDVDRRNKEIDELKDTVNGLVKEVKLLKEEREKFDRLRGSIQSAWNDFDREIKSIQEEVADSPTKPSTPTNIRKRKKPSEGDIEAGGGKITSIQEEVESPTKPIKRYKPSRGDIARGGREITSIQEEAAESPTKPNTRNQTRRQKKPSTGDIVGGPANQAFS